MSTLSAAMPVAEILAVGDELLSGETIDSNSSHVDGVLEALGYVVARHQTVPDDVDAIARAVAEAAERAPVVVTTGGLGPTQDDLTFEGVARAAGAPLELDARTLARIEARFARFGRVMTPNNRRQALLPKGATVLDNEVGTAPALEVAVGSARVFVLPGVPREMRWLLEHRVRPRLPRAEPLLRKTIAVAGIGESQLETELLGVIDTHPEIRFGFRTRMFENQVKLLARGADAPARLEAARRDVLAVLGDRAFGEDGVELEAVVVDALRGAGHTIVTAESCTGGWIAKLLTDVSGASAVVLGGVVAYANDAKERLLGVPRAQLDAHGAVSEVVARSMAEGARAALGGTWAVSATGVAGPGGGTPDKPVGLVWLALAGPLGTESWSLHLGGRDREVVRLSTAKSALDRVRRALLTALPEQP